MNIKLFAMGILLALTGVLTGCSSNESSERELSEVLPCGRPGWA